jgi:multidrug resistance efflux pump
MAQDVLRKRREQVQCDAIASLVLASNRLQLAVFERERVERGLTPAERRRLEVAHELRRIECDEAAEALAREQALVRDGLASPASIEDAERRLAAAKTAAAEAGIELAIRTGPPRAEDLLEAVRMVVRLQGECDRGQRAMARRLARADAMIAESDARVAMDLLDSTQASNQLARCAVVAPTTGVFRVRWFSDWRRAMISQPIKPGVSRGELDRVADIVQPGAMRVLAMIHEADIAAVTTGRSARVTIPALNNLTFAGTVVALGGLGRDRYDVAPPGVEQSVSGVTVFNATLALHGEDERLRPGMSARIAIEVSPVAPRLLVPREAVGSISGETAQVVRPGGRRVTVTGRLFGPRHFWVRQGLQPGDRILARFPPEES